MKDYGNPEMQKQYGLTYDLYGTYIDWKIDHNIFPKFGIADPHGIDTFQDFYAKNTWQIAKIRLAGRDLLIADINLTQFSYAAMTNLKKHVLKQNIPGSQIVSELLNHSKETGIPILGQLPFYLAIVSQQQNHMELVYNPRPIKQ